MTYSTLVSGDILEQHLDNPNWVIVDCRFSLANFEAGSDAYRHGHIPNARYADTNKDLSSAIRSYTGRHPLPDFKVLADKLGAWGINNNSQVVVYDDAGGAFAGRLWWLLQTLGHQNVAVLDGGIKHWQQQKHPVTTALPRIKPCVFRPYPVAKRWLNATEVQNATAQKTIKLIDARTPERYRGEQEPIDPVAGHIPSALNRPFQCNLGKNGLFLPKDTLHQQFKQLIASIPAENVVHYCGSGVTACHNLLAMEHAGLTGSRLYAGSWSEWIRNKNRGVAKV